MYINCFPQSDLVESVSLTHCDSFRTLLPLQSDRLAAMHVFPVDYHFITPTKPHRADSCILLFISSGIKPSCVKLKHYCETFSLAKETENEEW